MSNHHDDPIYFYVLEVFLKKLKFFYFFILN